MLQRQIMFKQLQELQRRQQFQELGDTRNQNNANQLSSLKQALGFQFPFSINGTPIQDSSQMYAGDNMNMSQHGESNGLVLSQSHNLAHGLSQQNFDMSVHGTHAPDTNRNFNQYSQLQGPSDFPVHLMPDNSYSLGVSTMQPSTYGNLFTSQRSTSDHVSMPDGALLLNQEKNLFGQVPIEGFNSGILSGNYSQQGIHMPKSASLLESEGGHQNDGWDGLSPGKTSKLGPPQNSASLDPLEQKILYSTDENIWESFGASSRASRGGLDGTMDADAFSSLQSGSWSALMQSAVAESSSTDAKMQEEWSGLSFQNPEPLDDDQPSNFINSEKQQNISIDMNLQNASAVSAEPGHANNVNCNFLNSLQPGLQPLNQKGEYQTGAGHATTQHSPRIMSQLADYKSQQKLLREGNQLIQTPLSSPDVWPGQQKAEPDTDNRFSGPEFGGWLQGSTSHHSFGTHKPYDQVNQLNMKMHPGERENITPGENAEAVSTLLRAPLDCPRDSVAATSESILEQLNKDDMSNDQRPAVELNAKVEISRDFHLSETSAASFAKPCNTSPVSSYCGFRLRPSDSQTPPSYTFSPSLSNSNATSVSGYSVNYHIKNQQGHMVTEFPGHIATPSQDNSALKMTHSSVPEFPHLQNVPVTQPSLALLQQVGFQVGQTSLLSDVAPNEQPDRISFHHESNQEVGTSKNSEHNLPQLEKGSSGREQGTLFPAGAFHHSVNHNSSLFHQAHASRNAETHGNKNFPPMYDNGNYQQSIANANQLFMSRLRSGLGDGKSDTNAALQSGENNGWNASQEAEGDESGKPSPMDDNKNFQQMGLLGQNDTSHFIGSNEASNIAYQSQISLQVAPSWFKQYGTLKNGQIGQMAGAKAAGQAQPFSETSATSKLPNHPDTLLPHATCQKWDISLSKKRKHVALEMIPWHKDINCEPSRLLDLSGAELEWVLTLNRRPQEVMQLADEEEIVEDIFMRIRAKRRLVSITQLMQQVFPPAPAVILCADASSSCDSVAYSSSRTILGDVCRLTVYQLPPNTNELSPDKLKTAKRTKLCKFSNVVEGLENRAKKLEDNLSRLDKSSSLVDIKVETQDLEKFSILNRFAKFHNRAHPSSINLASPSGASTLHKTNPQRYVVAVPMPKSVPEGFDCLSL